MKAEAAKGPPGSVALALAAALLPAVAFPQPLKPPVPPATAFSAEVPPTSRAMLSAIALLRDSRFSEANLRGAGGLASRLAFPVAGATATLLGSSDPLVPRRALGPSAGVAFLVKLPTSALGIGASDPAQDPAYALATVAGTRVKVWAVYATLPSDYDLSRRMIAAFAGIGASLATFDPTFTPGPGQGGDQYLLK